MLYVNPILIRILALALLCDTFCDATQSYIPTINVFLADPRIDVCGKIVYFVLMRNRHLALVVGLFVSIC